jgi:predicted DNA-binding mobile mystery protein A
MKSWHEMNGDEKARDLRHDLDARRATWNKLAAAPAPRSWIHHMRSALGMTTRQLGRRMKINQSAIVEFEKSEAKGAIQLGSLRRAAAAMNCRLVYAFVPDGPLEKRFDALRLNVTRGDLKLYFGKRTLPACLMKELVKEYAKTIKDSRVWETE